jgi:catalase (peroxidase I)
VRGVYRRDRCEVHTERVADGFRNYVRIGSNGRLSDAALVDRAQLLKLRALEVAVLVAGMRVLDANIGGSKNARLCLLLWRLRFISPRD